MRFLRNATFTLQLKTHTHMLGRVFTFIHVSECTCACQSLLSCPTLQHYGLQPARLLCPWVSLSKSWSRLPCPLPGDVPSPGIESTSQYVSCIGRRVLHHQHHQGAHVSETGLQLFNTIVHCTTLYYILYQFPVFLFFQQFVELPLHLRLSVNMGAGNIGAPHGGLSLVEFRVQQRRQMTIAECNEFFDKRNTE